ncbi:hypothetical protein F511_11144 [Dorcoceras hygrometricum]|nr:hypothetical protein F511_11144 [Dorcoceras hygrometricum]
MASSLVDNAIQLNFDSVLGIPDNYGMVKMFRALESTGLRGFLGCPKWLDRSSKRDKGYAAQICVLLKGDPAVTLEEAATFPPLKNSFCQDCSMIIDTEEDSVKNKEIDIQLVETKTGKEIDPKPMEDVGQIPLDEESLSIDNLLKRIPEDMMLLSVTAIEPAKINFVYGITIKGVTDKVWYKASLPIIVVADKGKVPLVEPDTVKGHPAHEMVQLICGDIEFLVQLRENVIDEVAAFFNSFSIRRLAVLQSVKDIAAKEEQVLTWALVSVGPVLGDRSIPRRIVDNISYRIQIVDSISFSSTDLGIIDPVVQVDADLSTDPVFAHQVVQMEEDQRPDPTESADIPLNDDTFVDQLVLPAPALPASVLVESLAQIRTSVSQLSIKQMRTTSRIGKLKNELLSKINNIEKAAVEARIQQDHVFRDLIKSVKQEVQLQKNLPSLEIIEFRKGVPAHSAIAVQDQQAALSNDLMEFRVQAQENYNNLTSQLSELVDYINRVGDAKKGESGSSRGPQHPPDDCDRSRPGGGGGSRSEAVKRRGSEDKRREHFISRRHDTELKISDPRVLSKFDSVSDLTNRKLIRYPVKYSIIGLRI